MKLIYQPTVATYISDTAVAVSVTIKVEINAATEYDTAAADRFTGLTRRSLAAPVTLSCTEIIFEQNATVTQHTASRDEKSYPATAPSIKEFATW